MTDSIGGLPFWETIFDANGDPDPASRDALLAEAPARGITDLVLFSHGWNNDPSTARRLYDGFFGLLAAQLAEHPAPGPRTVGLGGVTWPSRRWSDEPIPDFSPVAGAPGGSGAASVSSGAAAVTLSPTVDEATLVGLKETFPAAARELDEMALLLNGPATDNLRARFHEHLAEFSRLAGPTEDDGEGPSGGPADLPGMLADPPSVTFARFDAALRAEGVTDAADDGTGAAGFLDRMGDAWHGAKEALRTATYWEMKNRAGVVGRDGLGRLLGDLHTAAPGIRVHLIGHSFGARLVSYALAGLPDPAPGSPVVAVTLLQGAFSHFAFTGIPLPFDAGRGGALAGMRQRIGGPLTVCYSTHDSAVGRFYPLASLAAGDDAAGLSDPLYRWGGLGADGAQTPEADVDAIRPEGHRGYRFSTNRILNVDASEVVARGGPPSGAHSDIVHRQLTWIVLAGGGLV